MSITGHLAQVTPAFEAELRKDPSRASAIVLSTGFGGLDLGAGGAEIVDEVLRGMGPVGCLWSLFPGFFRRWLLGRLLPAGAPSDASRLLTPEERAEILEAQRAMALAMREAAAEGLPPRSPDGSAPPGDGDATAQGDDEEDDLEDDPGSDSDGAGFGMLPVDGELLAHLDLHKHWQILHFALTGQVEGGEGPAADAVLGGEEIGEDVGYGPVRVLSVDVVRAVAAHLEQVGVEGIVQGIRRREVPPEVYGADFAREWEELRLRARALCAFYAEAAREGRVVLAWLA